MKKKVIGWIILLAIIGGSVYYFVKPKKSESKYITAKAKIENIKQTVSVTGKVESINKTILSFESVGAIKNDILFQFIFESIFLTLLGGLFGIIIGFLVIHLITYFISKFGFIVQLEITLKAILIGVGFSGITGLIFGFYPARNASQLNPAEALRKE